MPLLVCAAFPWDSYESTSNSAISLLQSCAAEEEVPNGNPECHSPALVARNEPTKKQTTRVSDSVIVAAAKRATHQARHGLTVLPCVCVREVVPSRQCNNAPVGARRIGAVRRFIRCSVCREQQACKTSRQASSLGFGELGFERHQRVLGLAQGCRAFQNLRHPVIWAREGCSGDSTTWKIKWRPRPKAPKDAKARR